MVHFQLLACTLKILEFSIFFPHKICNSTLLLVLYNSSCTTAIRVNLTLHPRKSFYLLLRWKSFLLAFCIFWWNSIIIFCHFSISKLFRGISVLCGFLFYIFTIRFLCVLGGYSNLQLFGFAFFKWIWTWYTIQASE